jgi:hypothetical protein
MIEKRRLHSILVDHQQEFVKLRAVDRPGVFADDRLQTFHVYSFLTLDLSSGEPGDTLNQIFWGQASASVGMPKHSLLELFIPDQPFLRLLIVH